MATDVDDLPAWELGFHWLGGRPSLNFTATVGERWRRQFERLREPRDLSRWFVEGDLSPRSIEVSRAELDEARALREALYDVFSSVRLGRTARPAVLRTINTWSVRPGVGGVLARRAGGLVRVPGDVTVPRLLADLARDGVDLASGPQAHRTRECARPDCALLFLDTSRAGSRRWCSMSGCGARDKMTTYRRRRQA